MTFKFNGDYHDMDQVAPYLDEFIRVLNEIESAGQYRYNDSFKGRIVGLDAATSKDEDTAIYLLQGLERIRAEKEYITRLQAEGYWEVEALPDRTRFAHVVIYREKHFVGGTGWIAKYADARILTDENHWPLALLEKGKRTHARPVSGCRVFVR